MSVYAYFLGGPEDLSKRVLTEAIPYYRVAEMPRVVPFVTSAYQEPPGPVSVRIHDYRLINRQRTRNGEEIAIYMHMGNCHEG